MDDHFRHEAYMRNQFEQFKALCRFCRECCGSQDGDPCEHLAYDQMGGTYFCDSYERRLSMQKLLVVRHLRA